MIPWLNNYRIACFFLVLASVGFLFTVMSYGGYIIWTIPNLILAGIVYAQVVQQGNKPRPPKGGDLAWTGEK